MITRDEIERLIPHKGAMCLLDRVVRWDTERLVAASGTHRDRDNPLREPCGLYAIALCEYAAQAMALHGALMRDPSDARAPTPGMLVSLRNVAVHVGFVDTIDAELTIEVERLQALDVAIQYAFRIRHADRMLIEGIAMIALQSL